MSDGIIYGEDVPISEEVAQHLLSRLNKYNDKNYNDKNYNHDDIDDIDDEKDNGRCNNIKKNNFDTARVKDKQRQ